LLLSCRVQYCQGRESPFLFGLGLGDQRVCTITGGELPLPPLWRGGVICTGGAPASVGGPPTGGLESVGTLLLTCLACLGRYVHRYETHPPKSKCSQLFITPAGLFSGTSWFSGLVLSPVHPLHFLGGSRSGVCFRPVRFRRGRPSAPPPALQGTSPSKTAPTVPSSRESRRLQPRMLGVPFQPQRQRDMSISV